MQKQPLIILTGPTAVGKTKASIGLAKAIGGEIISADSMQPFPFPRGLCASGFRAGEAPEP